MYVIIREMRPYLAGYYVDKSQLKNFLKNFKDFTSEIEIIVMEGNKEIMRKKIKPKS